MNQLKTLEKGEIRLNIHFGKCQMEICRCHMTECKLLFYMEGLREDQIEAFISNQSFKGHTWLRYDRPLKCHKIDKIKSAKIVFTCSCYYPEEINDRLIITIIQQSLKEIKVNPLQLRIIDQHYPVK